MGTKSKIDEELVWKDGDVVQMKMYTVDFSKVTIKDIYTIFDEVRAELTSLNKEDI